jgi:hypothetical protein
VSRALLDDLLLDIERRVLHLGPADHPGGSSQKAHAGDGGDEEARGGVAVAQTTAPAVPAYGEGSRENAAHYIDGLRQQAREHWKARKTFDQLLPEMERDLRAEPLVHATSAEAAAQIWEQDGEIRSRAEMQKDIAGAEATLLDLLKDFHAREGLPPVTLTDLKDYDPETLGAEGDEWGAQVRERVKGLLQIRAGMTYPADTEAGLDRYVFAHHGRTAEEYGDTKLLLDNALLDQPGTFATPKDIVMYAWTSPRYFYPTRVLQQYRREAVTGNDYWQAAAAKRAAVYGTGAPRYRFTEDSFEVKIRDRVSRDRILGVLAGTLEGYQRLVDAGVPEARLFYLPSEASNYAKKFQQVSRHFQEHGTREGLPNEEALTG